MFTRSWDSCQGTDKENEVKKVLMKPVPVISEIFNELWHSGPFTESEKRNRYILTAVCMTSIYPYAILIEDTRSESVIDWLLIVFIRLGFSRKVQCDLGTYFTSVLYHYFFLKVWNYNRTLSCRAPDQPHWTLALFN